MGERDRGEGGEFTATVTDEELVAAVATLLVLGVGLMVANRALEAGW